MSHRVRVRLAGLERMGRVHSASLTTRRPSAELACVFDADTDLASSFDAIVNDEKVDAVAIATQ
jgi:predicted dehydrogenase